MKDIYIIKDLKQTIDDLTLANEQLKDDLNVALVAMGKMEDALKSLKYKKWYQIWK